MSFILLYCDTLAHHRLPFGGWAALLLNYNNNMFYQQMLSGVIGFSDREIIEAYSVFFPLTLLKKKSIIKVYSTSRRVIARINNLCPFSIRSNMEFYLWKQLFYLNSVHTITWVFKEIEKTLQ